MSVGKKRLTETYFAVTYLFIKEIGQFSDFLQLNHL